MATTACAEPAEPAAPRAPAADQAPAPRDDDERVEPKAPSPAVQAPPGATAEPATAPAELVRHEAIDEAAARALLERWVETQNDRKFELYAGLYHERFVGVKRSGSRERRFDRSGWLEDREKMFKRPMKVRVEDVRITTVASTAVISFRQTWASRSYADKGPKRIVALPTSAGLRIASEEMLASDLVRRGSRGALPPANFMFVIHGGDSSFVVLSSDADEAWAQGPPALAHDDVVVTTTRAVRAETLPEELRKLEGLEVQLLSAGGIACRGAVGAPQLMRRLIPHFGTRQYWAGDEDGDAKPDRPRLAAEAIAAEAWDLETGRPLLVAPLVDPKGNCRAAMWARSAALPKARIFTGTPATDEAAIAVTQKVRALPAYTSIQREFRSAEDTGGQGDWELYEGRQPTILTFRDGKRTFHSYHAASGVGCGAFEGELWALFEVMGDELWLLTDPRHPQRTPPLAVIDVDGDDLIEVITATWDDPSAGSLLRQRPDKGFDSALFIGPEDLDCGC